MSRGKTPLASLFAGLCQDLRLGVRALRRGRASSAIVVATIALGVGASGAIFSYAVLLKPLPYEHADRIVRIRERPPAGGTNPVSTPDYLDWRSASTVFEELAVEQRGTVTLTGSGEPKPLRVLRVTASYFDVFGERAALGRTFVPGEDAPGNEHVVMLSYSLL